MVKHMKINILPLLLLLGSHGAHATPELNSGNNFITDKLACPAATFYNNTDVTNYFKQWPDCEHADEAFVFKHADNIDFSAFNNITSVKRLSFYDTDFKQVSHLFPELSVAGSVVIQHSTNLSRLAFPDLSVADSVAIKNSTDLSSQPFPALKAARQLIIIDSTNLTNLTFPGLAVTGLLKLSNTNQAYSLENAFPKLVTIDTLQLLWNDQLKSVRFPELETLKKLDVEFNKRLRDISMPKLRNSQVRQLTLAENNPDFEQMGGKKGGLKNIKHITDRLTLISHKFFLLNYPANIKALHFHSHFNDHEIMPAIDQVFRLNPFYRGQEKAKVIFDKNECDDFPNIDTSEVGFDIYAGYDMAARRPGKCGNS